MIDPKVSPGLAWILTPVPQPIVCLPYFDPVQASNWVTAYTVGLKTCVAMATLMDGSVITVPFCHYFPQGSWVVSPKKMGAYGRGLPDGSLNLCCLGHKELHSGRGIKLVRFRAQ